MSDVKVLVGDCRDVMETMDADSVDAIVCDPPYELGFMSKRWDSSGVAFEPETWRKALRVAKPGAHLIAFGGTRTYHRLACAIEDAGWEIRDDIGHAYENPMAALRRQIVEDWDILDAASREMAERFIAALDAQGGPLAWLFGSGFPKSLNVLKAIRTNIERQLRAQGVTGDIEWDGP